MTDSPKRRRGGGRGGGRSGRSAGPTSNPVQRRTPIAGRLSPLSLDDITAIKNAALQLLETVGLSDAPRAMQAAITARGGHVTAQGRLCFPQDLVRAACAGLRRGFTLYARAPAQDLTLDGPRVHSGTGGASPQIIDLETEAYRPATLSDIYDAARLVDTLDHIHFFARPMVACDIENARSLDINTAFACLSGTTKHILTSASHPDHVREIADMCYAIAGGRDAFVAAPFLSLNVNHVVPPLRFSTEACETLEAAVRAGIPVMVNTFGQMGASSPVTLAGCLAQTHAETLAGMVYAWVLDPQARAIYGARPMVTDLRTGGMAGGGGEQALLTAAATQIARAEGLANSTIAGATDSKAADAQSGYEKALAVTMAAQAGSNLITQAAGTQAGLMATSLAAYVIDNDMLGAILQSAGGIAVTPATLGLDAIAAAVSGDGHFLGDPETYARMNSDFVYPGVADRSAPDAWLAAGAPEIKTTARAHVRRVLSAPAVSKLAPEIEAELRARFDILLPPSS